MWTGTPRSASSPILLVCDPAAWIDAPSPDSTPPAYPRPMPDLRLERRLPAPVAGVDEVGRGPLAGPVLAAAVIFLKRPPRALASLIDDSKALSAEARDQAATALQLARLQGIVVYALAAASVPEIARLNILHAAELAMCRAVQRLPVVPASVLVDGKRCPRFACEGHPIVGGDAISLSIAAASILAKVVRDRAMARLAQRHAVYAWERNAGYPTAAHRAAIEANGVTRHHRPGFALVDAARARADLAALPEPFLLAARPAD